MPLGKWGASWKVAVSDALLTGGQEDVACLAADKRKRPGANDPVSVRANEEDAMMKE